MEYTKPQIEYFATRLSFIQPPLRTSAARLPRANVTGRPRAPCWTPGYVSSAHRLFSTPDMRKRIMTRDTVSVDANGHHIGGISTELQAQRRPLIVALHGGSYTSAYFDVPGHSLLDLASANSIDVIALDRPCYGRSDPLPEEEVSFRRNSEILTTAIARLWDKHGAKYSGVVLIGHSMGAAIAMYIAAGELDWPLLGISLSGIHDTAPPIVRSAWDSMPPGQPVVFSPEQRRMFFYGPDWTIEPGIVERAEVSASPIPLAELQEVVGSWPESAADVAARIFVPVQYVAFEFESLWTIDSQTVNDFGGHFTAAPYVSAEIMAGTGHDVDHHRLGQAFQLRQFAFALECAERSGRPVESDEDPA
jgi:pimeloyl-ACP methyl ester carboxylesterase